LLEQAAKCRNKDNKKKQDFQHFKNFFPGSSSAELTRSSCLLDLAAECSNKEILAELIRFGFGKKMHISNIVFS
jgi:hypothetical protein